VLAYVGCMEDLPEPTPPAAPSPAPSSIDEALITASFELIAEVGWRAFSLAEAARRANLPLADVRARFSCRLAMLARFDAMLDQSCLTDAITDGPVRDRLFDIVMRRIDGMQAHRAGVTALMRDLPLDPLTALALAPLSLRSMGWLLEGVGVSTAGITGKLRTKGMLALWLHTLHAWSRDDSEDLSATMVALDNGLTRAAQAEATLADLLGEEKTAENPT